MLYYNVQCAQCKKILNVVDMYVRMGKSPDFQMLGVAREECGASRSV